MSASYCPHPAFSRRFVDPPVCEACDKVLTVHHILMHCNCYNLKIGAYRQPTSLLELLYGEEAVLEMCFLFFLEGFLNAPVMDN